MSSDNVDWLSKMQFLLDLTAMWAVVREININHQPENLVVKPSVCFCQGGNASYTIVGFPQNACEIGHQVGQAALSDNFQFGLKVTKHHFSIRCRFNALYTLPVFSALRMES